MCNLMVLIFYLFDLGTVPFLIDYTEMIGQQQRPGEGN